MNIAIIYSLPTRRAKQTQYLVADEDTKASAIKVFDALKEKGKSPKLIPVSEDSIDTLSAISFDCVVNLIEWTGADTPLSLYALDLLEERGKPFTGATRANFAMTTDKIRMKEALDANNLPTSRWQTFVTGNETVRKDFAYPVIVKVSLEHCSIGLTHDAVVSNAQDLARVVKKHIAEFDQPVVAEEFITGREFQVTVLDRSTGLTVLPPAEIFFTTKGGFLTYGGRWDETHPDYHTSSIALAVLSPGLAVHIKEIAERTFTRLDFRDYNRLDIRVRDEEVFILEANSNPGLDDDPEYGITIAYKAVGMTFADFIWEIVLSSLRRSEKGLGKPLSEGL